MYQYGLVTKDMRAARSTLDEADVGPSLFMRARMKQWYENDERKPYTINVAFAYAQKHEFEVLGPGKGSDFHERDAKDGQVLTLQHVAVAMPDIETPERALLDAGYKRIAHAQTKTGPLHVRISYIDTSADLGVYVELSRFRFLGRFFQPSGALNSRLARLQKLGR